MKGGEGLAHGSHCHHPPPHPAFPWVVTRAAPQAADGPRTWSIARLPSAPHRAICNQPWESGTQWWCRTVAAAAACKLPPQSGWQSATALNCLHPSPAPGTWQHRVVDGSAVSLPAYAYPLVPFQVPLGAHVPPVDNPWLKVYGNIQRD